MKPSKKASKSVFRALLTVQGQRDDASGLRLGNRYFLPEGEVRDRQLYWRTFDVLLLIILVTGLMSLLTTGYGLRTGLFFYPVLWLLCIAIYLTGTSRILQKYQMPLALIGILFTALLIFLLQDTLVFGARAFYSGLISTIGSTYNSSMAGQTGQSLAGTGSSLTGDLLADDSVSDALANGISTGTGHATGAYSVPVSVFLLLCAAFLIIWLVYAFYGKQSFLMGMIPILPILMITAVSGGAGNAASLFLVFFGILGYIALLRVIRRKRMWGGDDAALYHRNEIRFRLIRGKSLGLVLGLAVLLTVPGYYLVRPFLDKQLQPAYETAFRLQSKVLGKAIEVLPKISADQWQLKVETTGGGVADGSLSEGEGYDLHGLEDLKITVTEKPEETIFLKGFVGSRYENNSWLGGIGSAFDGAAMNWNVESEGSLRTYIQNLPFLRMAYALSQNGSGSGSGDVNVSGEQNGLSVGTGAGMAAGLVEPIQIRVERINAGGKYTYVPYGVYLNDYYKVEDGDGYVTGQTEQDDDFLYFSREDMKDVLASWSDRMTTESVLDRIEEAYRAYADTNDLAVAEGLEDLQAQILELMAEKNWKPEKNQDEIISWMRGYLAEHYTYNMNVKAPEEGEDFLQKFLYETKEGYSVHFATAAVQMFRMFGIPARYVVGYEAPAGLFTAQSGGSYSAVLQDDQSQAWAEIYLPGIGWMPQDMTPGIIGTLEEVGSGGEKIEVMDETDQVSEKETEDSSDQQPAAAEKTVLERLTDSVNNVLMTKMTVSQFVHRLSFMILLAGLLAMAHFLTKTISLAMGYDLLHKRSPLTRYLLCFGACAKVLRRKGLDPSVDSESEAFWEAVEKVIIHIESRKVQDYVNDHKAGNNRTEYKGNMNNPKFKSDNKVDPCRIRETLFDCVYGDRTVSEADIAEMRNLLIALIRGHLPKQG